MKAWENFLALLEIELGVDTVRKWLRPLKIVRFDACNLYLEAKDSFQALWFEEHIRQKAKARLVGYSNKPIKIHLSIANAPVAKKAVKAKAEQESDAATPPFALNFDNLDLHFTLPNFLPVASNELPCKVLWETTGYDPAEQSCTAAKRQLSLFNPIYLHGPSGTGKTHLLMAVANALRQQGLNAIYTRTETFTEHVVSAIRAGEMALFRQAYRNIDVLIIDDAHVFSRKSATQEELFHTFNTLHLAGKQIILSANCAPSELQYIEPRLVSRFEWGIVLPLLPPNDAEKLDILMTKAHILHFDLKPKIAQYLIETFKSGTKALIRALEALILRTQQSRTTGAGLTILTAKSHLNDLIAREEQLTLTPEKVIHTVAETFGIKPEDILGKAQSRDCVLPRQIAMHICRQHLKLPFMKIGDLFERDHSTVMSSVKLVQKNLDTIDSTLTPTYHAIVKQLMAKSVVALQ